MGDTEQGDGGLDEGRGVDSSGAGLGGGGPGARSSLESQMGDQEGGAWALGVFFTEMQKSPEEEHTRKLSIGNDTSFGHKATSKQAPFNAAL